MTPQEVKVWNWLREQMNPMGWRFRRQVRIGAYIADFAKFRPRVVIEIDGDSHFVADGPACDAERDKYFAGEGFHVIRFTNSEVGHDGRQFADRLAARLNSLGLDVSATQDPTP